MARKRMNNIVQWFPSEDELRVIECLATGHSQQRAAQITKVPQQTISRWYQDAAFQAMVADKTVEFLESRQAIHDQSVALAELIVHQGLTGDHDAGSPTVDLAFRVLYRTAWAARRGEKRKQFGKEEDDA